MKKLLIFALIILLFCACAESGETEALSPISYDVGEIIARNESIEGSFTETDLWASDYCLSVFPDCDVLSCEYLSGFVSPDSFMQSPLRCGSALWNVALSDESTHTVQIIYVENDNSCTLCGVFEGDAILNSRPAVYSFVRTDARFSALCNDFPSISDGLFEHKLPLEITDCADTVLLDENTLLAVEIVSYGFDGRKPSMCLHFYSVATGDEIRRETLSDKTYLDCEQGDGVAVITFVEGTDFDSQKYEYRIGATGEPLVLPKEEDSQVAEANGTPIYSDEDGIRLGTELILPATGTDTDIRLPKYICTAQDGRIIYSVGGWEWTWNLSAYDINTKTSSVLCENETPLGVFGNKLFLLPDGNWEVCGGLHSLDLRTLSEKTAVPARTDLSEGANPGIFSISPDGTLVSVVRTLQNEDQRLEIYSLNSGKLLSETPLDGRVGYVKHISHIGASPAVVFHLYESDSDILLW